MSISLNKPIIAPGPERHVSIVDEGPTVDETPKSKWQRVWPVIACGAGLFSDGYINGVFSSVNVILAQLYPTQYSGSNAQANIGSINFVGIVVGQLLFGWTSDHWSRKWSLLISTVVLFVFNVLATGAYAGGSVNGMLAALAAYRFLTGIGIGGEYPAGSVGCAESTGELEAGSRNRWFIWFTNLAIDIGFVVSAIVPIIVVLATGDGHLRAAWRIMVGIGCIPPLSLLYARWKLQEPEAFKRESMAKTKTPWGLVVKFYWFRLLVVSSIWFIYDFSAYGFGFYSGTITETVLPKGAPLWRVFGWNTVINLFYIPGAVAGSFISDRIGPRKTLFIGVFLQALIGFLMAGVYDLLSRPQNIAGFCVVYGIFLSLGELGPGDNIGLVAAKTSATPIRGQYYAIAAATGKIGAYIAVWVFKAVEKRHPGNAGNQDLFWIASPMALLSAALTWFALPEINQDTIDHEDRRFRAYLQENGYDTSKMGLIEGVSPEDHMTQTENYGTKDTYETKVDDYGANY